MKSTSNDAAQISALAREHGTDAIKTLAEIMSQEDGPAAARLSAAQALLDRGWGKAGLPASGDGESAGLPARIERVIIDHQKNGGGDEAEKCQSSDAEN
jgi:hypothetical protein